MYQKILFSCLLFIFVFGCKKDNQTNVIVDIEDDFYIDMFEDISNGERRFQLDITTIKDQSCINYQIDFDLDFDEPGRKIGLTLNDLIEPEDCIEGMSPVSLTVPVGSVASDDYTFNINLKDAVINQGQLKVTDYAYQLEMDSDDGIQLVHEQLNRIPENTLWGYIAFDNNASAPSAEGFLSDLENLSTVSSIRGNTLYEPGFFGYFDLDDDLKILWPTTLDVNNFIPFIFSHNSTDLSDIKEVINDVCADNENIEIVIASDTGWTYDCN